MDWEERLGREALRASFEDFSLLYHVGVRPAVPKEYEVPGIVGLTFRYRRRPDGAWLYATVLDAAAALRVGQRIGLSEGESLAMVDSHERMHVHLQLAGVEEELEEEKLHLVDATWLSLRHPRAAQLVRAGKFGLVSRVEDGFWEALIDAEEEES
ncbi:MAG: hypothetical protein LC624_12410 [Halobacteriales archaeon]|nr:hypothetical protein [Halobacteriales archaeon]